MTINNLTKLGNPDAPVDRHLEVIPYKYFTSSTITLECTEFTCRCPLTNQPDWANITIIYIPREYIVESKSVKLYMETWREVGIFHEELAQEILKDFYEALAPHWISVEVKFNTRGGIAITAEVERARSRSRHE